jgi:Ca2+-binding EF-hand superfamily protein
MKKILISGVAVAALAGLAPAIAQSAPTAAPQAKTAQVAKPLTRAEVAQKAQQHFTKLDANKDGFLTKAEADAAAHAVHERVEQRMDKRGDAMFARFDANKDGKVTRAEADAVFAAHKGSRKDGKAAPSWDKFAGRLDTDKNGAVSNAEFDAGHAKFAERAAESGSKRGLAGNMFTTADSNKDGKVSLAEATATATAHFDKVDANKDGKLTRDERRVVRNGTQAKPAGR